MENGKKRVEEIYSIGLLKDTVYITNSCPLAGISIFLNPSPVNDETYFFCVSYSP